MPSTQYQHLYAGLVGRIDVPMSEVRQHRTREDAWTVLRGKVSCYYLLMLKCVLTMAGFSPGHSEGQVLTFDCWLAGVQHYPISEVSPRRSRNAYERRWEGLYTNVHKVSCMGECRDAVEGRLYRHSGSLQCQYCSQPPVSITLAIW